MTEKILTKIRSLIGDSSKTGFYIFTYTNSDIFILPEANASSVTSVLVNSSELQSGESYSFDSDTNKLTIIGASLSVNDSIQVDYVFNEYNDTELKEHIMASLVWMSIFSACSEDYEFEDDDIYPSPDNRTCDLISIIASILIKPNYHEYRLPNLVVKCPQKIPKEDKIEDLIDKFNRGIGAIGIIEIDLD